MIARSNKETFDYILEAERELLPNEQTVFHLRRLDTRTVTRINDLDGTGQVAELVLRAGVAGWERLADAEGAVVEARFDRGDQQIHGIPVRAPLSVESMNRLPVACVAELCAAIMSGNRLSETDRGNSQ